jgi:ATP-binding cassette subfamily F protein 3
MSLLTLTGVGREIGAVTILEGVSVSVAAGERVGLVGPNGAGKTTLLRMMVGREEPDGGRVEHARGIRIEVLAQESSHDPKLLEAATLTEAVRGGAEEITRLAAELHAAETGGRADTPEYAAARQRFDALEGYTIDDRVAAALRGLGFPTARHGESPKMLSGGEQTRVALARLVIADPDLLLLDEPTNHLDVEAIEWLEGALRARRGALVVASHDRSFLDTVVDRVWEVRNRTVTRFRGNYSAYAQQREGRELDSERDADRRTKEIARERELIQTYRSHRKYGKMHEHERRLAAIEPVVAPKRRAALAISAAGAGRGPAEPVRLVEAVVGYREPTLRTIASARSIALRRGERIGIVGPNGAGKTTLLKSIAGILAPLSGEIQMASGVVPGYLAQVRAAGLHGTTVIEALRAAVPVEVAEARAHLARFLFRGSDIDKEVAVLSGGERSRLELAILGLLPSNLLLLDEPTNHLDVDACESLERFLLDGERTVLLVSHDRRLLEKICTELWVVNDGRIVRFDGGWRAWRAAVAEGWNAVEADEGATAARAGHGATKPASSKRAATASGAPRTSRASSQARATPLPVVAKLSKEQARRRRAAIEADLERHGLRKSQLELSLLDPKVLASYTELANVSSELADVTAALAAAEEAWLALEGEAVG